MGFFDSIISPFKSIVEPIGSVFKPIIGGLSDVGKEAGSAVGVVYKDVKSVVSAGGDIVKDVAKLPGQGLQIFTNPLFLVVAGTVGVVVLLSVLKSK